MKLKTTLAMYDAINEEVNKSAPTTKKILVTRELAVAIVQDHAKLYAACKEAGLV